MRHVCLADSSLADRFLDGAADASSKQRMALPTSKMRTFLLPSAVSLFPSTHPAVPPPMTM